jgi:Na+-transporting methylmalonyl-CoA/oxaloacetate decarboxylase gamma subunit
MIAGLIFVISFLTLLQFFVSYCRSLIAESRSHDLSEHAREISGVTSKTVRGDQFKRLLQLLAMCPESYGDSGQVHALSTYFSMLDLARMLLSRVAPSAAQWIESERGGCAYVAAVALDRRIARNRLLMAQQAGQ